LYFPTFFQLAVCVTAKKRNTKTRASGFNGRTLYDSSREMRNVKKRKRGTDEKNGIPRSRFGLVWLLRQSLVFAPARWWLTGEP
jgi:hypothetical protein